MSGKCPFSNLSRRGFFKALGGAGLVATGLGSGAIATRVPGPTGSASKNDQTIPFHGKYQAGIDSQQQSSTYFAAFDLTTKNRADIIALFKKWTVAAERITQGGTAAPLTADLSQPAGDSGDAIDLTPARLTLTFGFGPGLFEKGGVDRYGLAAQKPAALVELPKFNGDQFIETRSDGDLSIQACADDPQVAFHAVRQLARLANDVAQIRWVQTGFIPSDDSETTPRNLLGFKDGTRNPKKTERDQFVWVGSEGPTWLQGGTYLVFRRIRLALEHWDGTPTDFQEQVIGRHKLSGAPLGGIKEFDPLDLNAADKDGNSLIPDNAHIRLATAANNGGAQILRRGYSYNDGVNFVAERWPPWRQGMEYDAGLLFMGYQRDPRTSFIKIFSNMAKLDALNQFATHTASALFVCPPGVAKGEFIGQKLFA